MQLLSAFSRPQTVPAVPKAAPKKTLWILNSWRDLILYVGTPLFLVPMFLLAGPEGDHCDRFLLGCLAWDDADLRFLSNLRREDGFLRCVDAPPRLCDLRHMVRGSSAPLTATHGRHAGNVLRQRRTIHSTVAPAQRTANRPRHCYCSRGLVPVQFLPDVGGGETPEPGEAGAAGHDYCLLVVLQ